MAEQNGTPQSPDSVITTQRDGQTIVAELFFNHSGTETFRDKLLKVILADSLQDGQEPEKNENHAIGTARTKNGSPGRFLFENPHFPQVKSRENSLKNAPLSKRGRRKESLCEQGFPSKKDHRHLV